MALRDKEAQPAFVSMESEARLVLNIEGEERVHTNRRYAMGGAI